MIGCPQAVIVFVVKDIYTLKSGEYPYLYPTIFLDDVAPYSTLRNDLSQLIGFACRAA